MFHAPTMAMMDNRYKCLTNLSNDGSEDLCFDMIEDRAETINLADEQRQRLGQTRKSLRQWLHSCKVSHNGGDYDEAFEPVAPFEDVTGDWSVKRKQKLVQGYLFLIISILRSTFNTPMPGIIINTGGSKNIYAKKKVSCDE